MINVMENKVLGPILQEQFELGRQKGYREGWLEGWREGWLEILQDRLTDKFGPLPAWAVERLQSASTDDLHTYAKRLLRAPTLEDTLR